MLKHLSRNDLLLFPFVYFEDQIIPSTTLIQILSMYEAAFAFTLLDINGLKVISHDSRLWLLITCKPSYIHSVKLKIVKWEQVLTLGRSLDILLQHCDRFRKISLFLFKYGVRLFSTRLMSKRPAPTECSCFQPLSTCFSTLTSHFEPDEGQSKLILSWPNQGSWRVKMVTSVSLRSAWRAATQFSWAFFSCKN